MSKKTIHDEARGRDIHDGKERALAKQRPTQLSLFQTFLPEDDKYSNTIEFGSCWIPGSWMSRWRTTQLLSSSLP
jgi:hypothetical protein